MHHSLPKSVTIAAVMACMLASGAHAAMTISNAKTKDVNCTGGVCTPTGGNANLNVGELQTMLASSDVTLKSNAAASDIGVTDPLTWASSHRLTLDAYESIHVRAPVVVEGTAGITLTTNDGGSGGDYTFNATTSGAIAFWDVNSKLVINGAGFTLVKDVATLASTIKSDPARNIALAQSYDASTTHVYRNPPVNVAYTGTFEGLGNAINGLRIHVDHETASKGVGLFAESNGTLRDVSLTNASVAGATAVGSLVGVNAGTISSVSAENVSVIADQDAGGIAGANGGVITSASSSGQVYGFVAAGGLVGDNGSSGQISQSNSNAAVSTPKDKNTWAGGLAGSNEGTISFSSAAGSVEASKAGGLVGEAYGAIINCRASGLTKMNASDGFAGGLIGWTLGANIQQSFATGPVEDVGTNKRHAGSIGGLVGFTEYASQIVASYASGAVIGPNARSGGLVGYNVSVSGPTTITQSYSVGKVTGSIAGGAIGDDEGSSQFSDIYWDFDTSGITNPARGAGTPANDPGITGLTDAQLKSALPAGFDPNVWGQSPSINNGWPYLLANPPQ